MNNQILSLFQDNKHQTCYRYILLDMLGRVSELSYLYIKELKESIAPQNIAVIKRPELAHNLSKCPHLICIAEPNEPLNQKLLLDSLNQALHEQLFNKHYVCGWLASELPPDELAEQLMEVGILMGRLFNSPFIPFYEPFRMQIFDDMNTACPEWLMLSLNSLVSYSYIDVTNKLRTLKKSQNESVSENVFISEELKFYQQESKHLFNLYLGWYEINERKHIVLQQYDFIEVLLCYRRSWRLGLTDTTDRFAYVYDTLKYGELEKNEEIYRAIREAIQEPGTLVKRLSSIDESYFLSLQSNQ